MREALIQIAERAATLEERLDGSFVGSDEEDDSDLVRLRLDRWKDTCARSDDWLFEKRLKLDNLTPVKIRSLLGPARIADAQKPPKWVFTLEGLIPASRFVEGPVDRAVPFQEALSSLVDPASATLKNRVGGLFNILTEPAVASLERTLLQRLSRICARPLALEMNVARVKGQLEGATGKDRYKNFLQNSIATPQGMLDFFYEYPVAGRLVAIQVDQWVESNSEFLTHLNNDLCDIAAQFSFGNIPGQVVEIRDCLSDSHNRGRYTKQITFASGLKIVYKPKNLTIDSLFQELLKSINATQKFLPQKTFDIWNCETHGWCEFLVPEACNDEEQVTKYFERAGMLLGLLHALGASDCHYENLFACGEYPVLVDLETLLEVRVREDKAPTADELAQGETRMSLLHTGMLPRWIFGEAGAGGADFSGLMGGGSQQYPLKTPDWSGIGTDRMHLRLKYPRVTVGAARPALFGPGVSTKSYLEHLEAGFSEMYEFMHEHPDILRRSGFIDKMARAEIRFLKRPTAEYALVLQDALNPRFLRDGIDRSIHLDLLCRDLFAWNQEHLWPLLRAEREALDRMDIPHFTVRPNEDVIIADRCKNTGVPTFPVLELLHTRISNLSAERMANQISLLRTSISMRNDFPAKRDLLDIDFADQHLRTPNELTAFSMEIGEILKDTAIKSPDGSVTWIGAEFVPFIDQFSIAPVQNSFYSGKTGIALFLAALNKIKPDRQYRELALASLQTLRAGFCGDNAAFHVRSMPLGAMSGIDSVCWSLFRIGEFLNEQVLLDESNTIASLITPEMIAKDRRLDVISGCAGTILSLLVLDPGLEQSELRRVAEQCGQHLLNQSVQPDNSTRAWETLRGERLTGFSHGAAGCGYALYRLFEASGHEEYRDAAEQAFAYERSLYSPQERNWPDLRFDSKTKFMTGWCHGAPGIALARIGCNSIRNSPQIAHEVENALDATLLAPLHPFDDVCCGNFSRIETLLIASMRMQRKELFNAALLRASAILERKVRSGAFALYPESGTAFINPGFMKGLSGIGYSLLRLAHPESLPSPLLL